MPGIDYTVASAQQLSGIAPLYYRLSDATASDLNLTQLNPTARRTTLPRSRHLPHRPLRIGNGRLATEIASRMLGSGPRVSALSPAAPYESDPSADTALLLGIQPSDSKKLQGTSGRKVTFADQKKLKEASSVRFRDEPPDEKPKLCVSKCFQRLKKQVSIRGAVKLDNEHVDSLSSAFAGRIKSLMLTQMAASPNRDHTTGSAGTWASITAYLGQPFIDTCITDNNIPGQIVKFQSRHFTVGTAGVRIGECEFFNLSPTYQGPSRLQATRSQPALRAASRKRDVLFQDPKRTLRIEVDEERRPRFILTLWGDLHPLSHCKTRLGWISNMDITDAIRKCAIAEHYRHVPGLTVRAEPPPSALKQGFKWECKESPEAASDQITSEKSGTAMSHSQMKPLKIVASPEIPSVYQDRVLHLISQFREHHSSVLVFSAEMGSSSATASSVFRLRFVSADVLRQREDLAHNISAMSKKAVEDLGLLLSGVEETTTHILWGKDARRTRLYCIPVMENRVNETASWPRWWVCFMLDSKQETLWRQG